MDGINRRPTPVDIDPRQRYFTTVQPFSYRDTLTALGYIQEVASHVDELREQLGNLAKDEHADIEAINGILARIETWQDAVDGTLDDLTAKLDQYQASALTYDPTTGRYGDSKTTDRNMYRELAVFGARVDQMASMTAAEAANHDCITWAVLGNREIFGDDEPRVTPRERTGRR
jgi:hypothetical protein